MVIPTITKGITRDNWFKNREMSDVVLGEIERCGSQFHEIVAEYGAQEKLSELFMKLLFKRVFFL